MMNKEIEQLQDVLSKGFHKTVFLKEKRLNIYQLFIPFFYPDGDMIEIFLSRKDDTILIQDLGMTLMRLSYGFTLDTKKKKEIFHNILNNYQITEENGNLSIISSMESLFPSVMQFIQVIIKVSDIELLKRENVKSLFYEYFENFIFDFLKEYEPVKDYYPDFDTAKEYPTPYAIMRRDKSPICFYPIQSNDKCKEVTIIIQHYELNEFHPDTIAVFEDQVSISRMTLARLSNVVGKQFATLTGNENRIKNYTERMCI